MTPHAEPPENAMTTGRESQVSAQHAVAIVWRWGRAFIANPILAGIERSAYIKRCGHRRGLIPVLIWVRACSHRF